VTLAGSWIYAAVPRFAGSALWVQIDQTIPALEPGGKLDDRGGLTQILTEGPHAPTCYVTPNGKAWFLFDNGWYPKASFRPAAGFPERMPPQCR
jgi:hypothetical protein